MRTTTRPMILHGPYTLVRVADGDTITIAGPTLISDIDRVRLLGVDAPERGEDGWAPAREYLASLVRGRRLRLEPAVGPTLTRGRCNRLLAWLWADADLVQLAMVRSGWCRSAHDWGVGTHTAALDAAAAAAEAEGLPRPGYWRRFHTTHP